MHYLSGLHIIEEVLGADQHQAYAYLCGASRDATVSKAHKTTRFAQNNRAWLSVLRVLLKRLGAGGWLYREGSRSVWVLETSFRVERTPSLTRAGTAEAFVRGYFDAEGGIPQSGTARFYLQMTQKDLLDLTTVREAMEHLGILCGKIHNPSKRVDPNYWRFYVRAECHPQFLQVIGSWHERKRALLEERFTGDLMERDNAPVS